MNKYVFVKIDTKKNIDKKNDIEIFAKIFEEDFSHLRLQNHLLLPKFERFEVYDKKVNFYNGSIINKLSYSKLNNLYEVVNEFGNCADYSVISFDEEIVIDENGEDYLFTIADIEYGEMNLDDMIYTTSFIVKLNSQQAENLDFDKDLSSNNRQESFEYLQILLNCASEKLYESIKKIYPKLAFGTQFDAENFYFDKLYVYVSKLN